MPPKAKVPAPIDRPLSRAYLREFSGWSTAYPPGISEPTSLRKMENVQVMRDGAVRVRPGLRYMSPWPGGAATLVEIVGGHEPFFLNNGNMAYLVAVRESDDKVGFRVLGDTGDGFGQHLHSLTGPGVEFTVAQGLDVLEFEAATTNVKFLQIDNKIFALSNAGETMRYFTVGANKTAKRLNAIERPAWLTGDKLTVVHPTKAWIDSSVPIATRTNLIRNPSFEVDAGYWIEGTTTDITRSLTQAMPGGSASGRIESKPTRTNHMPYPIGPDWSFMGPTQWTGGGGIDPNTSGGTISMSAFPGTLAITLHDNIPPSTGPLYINSPRMTTIEAGVAYTFSIDIEIDNPGQIDLVLLYRWYDSGGTQIGGDATVGLTYTGVGDRHYANLGASPGGAAQAQVFLAHYTAPGFGSVDTTVNWANAMFARTSEPVTYFDGSSGADYHWVGAVNSTPSYYHPDAPVDTSTLVNVSAGADYTASAYLRAHATVRNWVLSIQWLNAGFSTISVDSSPAQADTNTSFTRIDLTGTAPPGAVYAFVNLAIATNLPRGEYHYFDAALMESGSSVLDYFDGAGSDTSTLIYTWTGAAHGSTSVETSYSGPVSVPPAASPTANTLLDSTSADNTYNFGFFYTFSNEVGESAASQVTVVKAQRGWSQWKWETANGSMEPTGTITTDPNLCADQLVAYMPLGTFNEALDQGATKWSLYMMTWSDQDPVPVQAVRLATRTLTPGVAHGAYGYLRMTPQQADANAEVAALPSEVNRFNYSRPSTAGNGIVAADRLIMVFDPVEPAVVRWSSAQMGNYADFTGSRGGGFKTLSSGNMYVPGAVVLWQNPQSADTITILCQGTDGKSTGYYMAPAQVASQSEAVNIMGFEETTATPGTVSPFGVEVFNNALYHPLDEMLMKSTATNYNINHSSLTDPIENMWQRLINKDKIVSAVHDNRIYYLVHNPLGEVLEDGCWGNEVWVFDAAQKAGSWSRWLVQGKSLKRIEQGDKTYMSLTRPDGIYFFDPGYTRDDYVSGGLGGSIEDRAIEWYMETNTQGANRAHDAWAMVQQLSIVVGEFQGQLRYGIRGIDVHGKMVDIAKVMTDDNPLSTDGTLSDLEDYLQIRRTMKEWFFHAGSTDYTPGGTPIALEGSGQISLVQYRYAPSTVNTGYEWGSIETFEYQRDAARAAESNTVNGVPLPYIDTGRP